MFCSIQVTKSLNGLVVEGTATDAQLQERWEAIMQEYYDCVKTEKSTNILECWKKILHTQWQMTMVDNCLVALRIRRDEEVIAILMDMGYWVDADAELLPQLKSIEAEAKNLVVFLNQYTTEYQALCPEAEEKQVERTLADYQKELAVLSKFMGYNLSKPDFMVLDFIGVVNLYLEANRTAKTQ